jgi:hypothetical protein
VHHSYYGLELVLLSLFASVVICKMGIWYYESFSLKCLAQHLEPGKGQYILMQAVRPNDRLRLHLAKSWHMCFQAICGGKYVR